MIVLVVAHHCAAGSARFALPGEARISTSEKVVHEARPIKRFLSAIGTLSVNMHAVSTEDIHEAYWCASFSASARRKW